MTGYREVRLGRKLVGVKHLTNIYHSVDYATDELISKTIRQ